MTVKEFKRHIASNKLNGYNIVISMYKILNDETNTDEMRFDMPVLNIDVDEESEEICIEIENLFEIHESEDDDLDLNF